MYPRQRTTRIERPPANRAAQYQQVRAALKDMCLKSCTLCAVLLSMDVVQRVGL